MILEDKRIELDKYLEGSMKDGDFPGYSYGLIIGHEKYYGCGGYTQIQDSKGRYIDKDTVFDIASLTKVVATTTCILLLIEEGKLSLDMRVTNIIPELKSNSIRVKHLLTHTSGLQPDLDYGLFDCKEKILNFIFSQEVDESKLGENILYSDLGFILLGEIVERLTDGLSSYFDRRIAKPLGMNNTRYIDLNIDIDKSNIAATEICAYRNRLILGEVHDEKAYVMGGIAGHAGLFSTSEDLLKFIHMILNGGRVKSKQVISPRIISLLKKCYARDTEESRTLGWITENSYHGMGDLTSNTAIFHTGFVGTSILIDFEENLGFVLLTNRVHPKRDNPGLIVKRGIIHNLAMLCKD